MIDDSLYTALRNADAAGDTAAAAKLAAYIKSQEGQAAPQQPPGGPLFDQIGRQLGLTGRYALEGAGNLAGVVSDPIGQFLPGYQRMGQAATQAANALGLPQPQGGLEQAVAAGSKALVGTGLTAGLGAAAGAPALAASPGLQAASAISGGMSSDVARQAGAGPIGQFAAGLAGGLAPSVPQATMAGVKAAFTGGESGRQNIEQALQDFAASGTTPSVGQATQNPFARSIEAVLSKMPGGHGPMSAKATEQADEIGTKLTSLADSLAVTSNPAVAGRAIERGVTGEGGFLDRFKATTQDLYDKVDQYVPGGTPVELGATKTTLAKLVNPVPGAENTSGVLSNPKLTQIADAIRADTNNQPGFGALPYEAVKQLRSKVGELIADSGLVSDAPRAQLKQLYGALSTDIRETVKQNPDAYAAANRAENYYRSGMDRIDKLNTIVNNAGGPEGVFQAALSGTREGATTINAVMRSLQPDEANIVTSAVLRRMGRANPSAQNDVGDVFSTERFLTNWNGLSPQAKSALFSRGGQDFQSNMDQIARVASNLREGSQIYRNPSGTAPAAAAAGTAGAAVLATLSGNLGAAATIGAGVGSANLSARLMTNPNFVSWLARQTTVPVEGLPAQISILANEAQKKKDPELMQLFQPQQQQ